MLLLGGMHAREGAMQALSLSASTLEMEMVVILAVGADLMAVRASPNVFVSRRRAARVANKRRDDVKRPRTIGPPSKVSSETERGAPSSLRS